MSVAGAGRVRVLLLLPLRGAELMSLPVTDFDPHADELRRQVEEAEMSGRMEGEQAGRWRGGRAGGASGWWVRGEWGAGGALGWWVKGGVGRAGHQAPSSCWHWNGMADLRPLPP